MLIDPELDHIFICSSRHGKDVRALAEAGFSLGLNRIHDGQGTANALFFFDNAYLELLWVNDEVEVRSEAVRPTALWERLSWRKTGACPFGISLRPGVTVRGRAAELETWDYEAPFLPADTTIPVVTDRYSPRAPFVFILPWGVAPADYPKERAASPLEHAGRRHKVTSVTVHVPCSVELSSGLQKLNDIGVVKFVHGEKYFLELELNMGKNGKGKDFRPGMPLWMRW